MREKIGLFRKNRKKIGQTLEDYSRPRVTNIYLKKKSFSETRINLRSDLGKLFFDQDIFL
jgi:hypothetical protein